jgi:hypothetical protein
MNRLSTNAFGMQAIQSSEMNTPELQHAVPTEPEAPQVPVVDFTKVLSAVCVRCCAPEHHVLAC